MRRQTVATGALQPPAAVQAVLQASLQSAAGPLAGWPLAAGLGLLVLRNSLLLLLCWMMLLLWLLLLLLLVLLLLHLGWMVLRAPGRLGPVASPARSKYLLKWVCLQGWIPMARCFLTLPQQLPIATPSLPHVSKANNTVIAPQVH